MSTNSAGSVTPGTTHLPLHAVRQRDRQLTAADARRAATAWVEASLPHLPGIVAAHFVGGITSAPLNAPFPGYKDVDLHLIFDEGSPALLQSGPFLNVIEVEHDGIAIEAGVKSEAEYRSAGAVLSNPEIAHHLLLDCIVHDPIGLLRDLQPHVKAEYSRRRWVMARVEHERVGLAGAMAQRQPVGKQYGPLAELTMLGYATTFLNGLMSVASLRTPRMGGMALMHLQTALAAYHRLDLYDELLEVLGVRRMQRQTVERWFAEATETFDLAVEVHRTPHPFQHKLQRHLRDYFVGSTQTMLDAGAHREAMPWITAYYSGTVDILLADGPEIGRSRWLSGQEELLTALGSETTAARAARFEQAHRLFDRYFRLAADIIDRHPAVVE